MGYNLKIDIRIDDSKDSSPIHRFPNEKSPIVCDIPADKLYRLKMINGVFNTQEITITDGTIVEVGDPVAYAKV